MKCAILVDANALLALYSHETPDLTWIERALENLEGYTLVVTDTIIDEWRRNREEKIAHSISTFKKQASKSFGEPSIIRELDIYSDFKKAKDTMLQLAKTAMEQARERAISEVLHADIIVKAILEKALRIDTRARTEIVEAATMRTKLENPPGKRNVLGDRLTWEALLQADQLNGVNLYILSDDSDYRSKLEQPLDCNAKEMAGLQDLMKLNVNQFLRAEWQRKGGELFLLTNWSCFIRFFASVACSGVTTAPSISQLDFVRAFERSKAVSRLISSASFKETHSAIEELREYGDFSKEELRQLLRAFLENTQIYWILRDQDVREFAQRLVEMAKLYSSDDEIYRYAENLTRALESKSSAFNMADDDLPF